MPSTPEQIGGADLFDIAVIGGGINGTGIARDVAGRGARVLLVERGDLASGTSSASTKLIHGGLRYLEHRAFGLVRESLVERETLRRAAPHLIQPMRFVLPASSGQRPRALIRAGLFLYDHIGGRKALPPARSIRLDAHPGGRALASGAAHGFEYSDCWCDDSRLVIANARDAAKRGATILPRHELSEARRDGDRWVLAAGGRRFAARALVNAAGPQLSLVNERLAHGSSLPMRLVRGSHIVVPRLFDHDFAYLFQNADGRVVFAIPYQGAFTLVGTTDVDQERADRPPRASEEEISYLINAANQQFRKKLVRGDIEWTYSGVRPLVDDESGRPEKVSRGYRLDISPAADGAPLLTVFGGKLTTYRHLGEKAGNLLSRALPGLDTAPWTANSRLPGGDFPPQELGEEIAGLLARYPFLGQNSASRIFKAYGKEAEGWLAGARSWTDLGASFGAGFSEAEARWMQEQEFASTSEDMLWRRSKLGLHMSAEERLGLGRYLGEEAA